MTGVNKKAELYDYAMSVADELGIDRAGANALFETENGWDNGESSDGLGYGLGQISYDLAEERGWNVFDDKENIRASLTYFREKLDTFYGDYASAYGAYNAGDDSSNWNYDNISRYMSYMNGGTTDTSLALPSEEVDLDLSHPLPTQEGLYDTNLSHTNKVILQNARKLNAWAYQTFGKDMVVSGGWRSEEYNASVNGAENSLHVKGQALDFNMDNFTDEEREYIIAKAQELGFNPLWHDAGSGLHLHLDVADTDNMEYIPVTEDYLPQVVQNANWFGINAMDSPVMLNKREQLGTFSLDSSEFWRQVETPSTLDAMWHRFYPDSWIAQVIVNSKERLLYGRQEYIESPYGKRKWKASQSEIRNATAMLFNEKKRAEWIAEHSHNETEFAIKLERERKWLEDEKKFKEYYNNLGLNAPTAGFALAMVLDPLNYIGVGTATKLSKVGAVAKIGKNVGTAIKNTEKIDRVATIASVVAENKIASTAIKGAKLLNRSGFSKGAVTVATTGMAQDYLLSKFSYHDTHLLETALVGGIAGGILGIVGRVGSKLFGRGVDKIRASAERVEEGTLREAVGLGNQYRVRVEGVIEKVAQKEDTGFFKGFSKAVTEIVDNNRVIAVSREDAKQIANDCGFELPKEAKAWHETSTDTTFVIKDAIKDEEDLLGVLRHEIGVHQNLRATMGDEAYERLMKQITNGKQNLNSVWAQATKHVDSKDPEEILGYVIEHGMLQDVKDMRFLTKGIRNVLGKSDLSDKEILDFVQQALTNTRLKKQGISLHENADGSTVINGVKFSKENMGNPNRILDTLAMAKAGADGVDKRKLGDKVLDAMDGKGVVGKLTMTNFGWLYHSKIPMLRKYASALFEDAQGRGTYTAGINDIPSVEEMNNYFKKQLIPYMYRIGEFRNNWLSDTFGKFSVYNPFRADSRRVPFNTAVIARFNLDYRGIKPNHVSQDLLENEHVINASKELKAYRDKMIELGKDSAEMLGLDEEGNMVEKAWEVIDNEMFRVTDDDAYMTLLSHIMTGGDSGVHDFLVSYAKKFADRELCKKVRVRQKTLENQKEIPKVQDAILKMIERLEEGQIRYSEYLKNDNGVVDNYLKKLAKWNKEQVELLNMVNDAGDFKKIENAQARTKIKKAKERLVKLEEMRANTLERLQNKILKSKNTVERGKSVQADRLYDLQEKIKHLEELKTPVKEPTDTEIEAWIDDASEGFAQRIMGEHGDKAFDAVDANDVAGSLSFFKQRLPMNTSGEIHMPDGYVFSFDKDLRSYDLDTIMQRTMNRFSGEASLKNFLINNGMTLEHFKNEVYKQISALTGTNINKSTAETYRKGFDDMINMLRGMRSSQDTYTEKDALLKILKNLAYAKNGMMMGVNQLEDLSSGVAHSGFGMVYSITRKSMENMMKAKVGDKNWEEIQNLSMLLEGEQVAGQLFKTGFRDNITRATIFSSGSRWNKMLCDVSDFSGNLANMTTAISQLGSLTDRQVRLAQAQAIVDSAQWAWGRNFSKVRNPFSKNKLKEIGLTDKAQIDNLKADIQKYLGWKGTKDSDFTESQIALWQKEHPETFWKYRQLIHNQVSRSVLLEGQGNANRLMQNSMIASSLLMFKGFSFRANNARFARALRTRDVDDGLAFLYSLMLSSTIYSARQIVKYSTLYAMGQTEQAEYIKRNYLNPQAIAYAGFARSVYMSPVSLANDMYEIGSGTPTVRTTVDAKKRQEVQDTGDLVGNWVAQTPVISTVDDMTLQPYLAMQALAEGRGSKSDALRLIHAIPIPNLIGLTQGIDAIARLTVAKDLPEKRKKRPKENNQEQQGKISKLLGLK